MRYFSNLGRSTVQIFEHRANGGLLAEKSNLLTLSHLRQMVILLVRVLLNRSGVELFRSWPRGFLQSATAHWTKVNKSIAFYIQP